MNASRLPLRASVRFYRQHPLQLALTLLGIALGAAVIVAVALATRAAAVSFDRSLEALAGPMTHELRARDGALDEDLYRALRVERGLRLALPLIRVRLTLDDAEVELVGSDPLALLGSNEAPGAVGENLATLLTEADTVLASSALAQELGITTGATLAARLGEGTIPLRVIAVWEAAAGDWLGDVLLADIATVQHLSGRRGELDSIQLKLTVEEAEALRPTLGGNVELRAYDDQRSTFNDMTRAFRTNLTAMSLLAVLVGAFLVYNAMTFAVVQRAQTFAVLRMLGTTPGQLFTRLLLEAAVLGLIGGALGLLLGLALGQSLLFLVARTVSDLYVTIEATRPDLAPGQLLAALAVTMGAVLLATLAPARDAAHTAPVSLERESTGQEEHGSFRLLLVGLGLTLACPLLIAGSGDSLVAGFAALSLLIAGYALLCPFLLRQVLAGVVRGASGLGGTQLQLALRGVQSSLPHTAPALIALAVAVSATVGVAIMIGSFRASVESWLGDTLQGDLYVYLDAEGERLDPAWESRLERLSGVQAVSAARQRQLYVDDELLRVLVLDETSAGARQFEMLAGPADAHRRLLQEGNGLLISEPLATRRRLGVGATMTVNSPTGAFDLPVRGIYRDYASSYGAVVMPLAVYAAHWQDRGLSSLALTLAADANADALRRQIQALGVADGLELEIVSNRAISERSLAIFDRTFVITDVLRALVIVVAFVGIVSALMALFLERRRDFAVLRATGVTPRQLQSLVLAQAATGGLLAGLLALPLGGAMSLLLIDVINRRSFGWTMNTEFDGSVALEALLLAVTAAALAALWPARRLAGGDLRDALYAP